MYKYNDFVKAHNVLNSILRKYEASDVDISTKEGILDNIRKQNIIRSIFDCIYLIDIEMREVPKEEEISVHPHAPNHEFQTDSEASQPVGKNRLCLYFFDSMYAGNRKIECYEHFTKERVAERISDGLYMKKNLMEVVLNGQQLTGTDEIENWDTYILE